MAEGMGLRLKVDLDSGVEDATLLILEWLGEQGVGAMIRVDAERMHDGQPAWTFAASGGPLDGGIRANGPRSPSVWAGHCFDCEKPG